MTTLCILSGNHLCHNPRVFKEANTLADAGFDVSVLGAWFDPILKSRDVALIARTQFKFIPVIDLTRTEPRARARRFGYRIRSKASQLAFRLARLGNRWQLGHALSALKRAAERSKADLFIGHSESSLAVANDLMKTGYRVGIDMEDWFSTDLLEEARRQRPVRLLRSFERNILRHAVYRSSPSLAMSQALAAEYDCQLPTVIYNAFAWADRQSLDGVSRDRRDLTIPSLHWYSQTLGLGRGLEDLVEALQDVKYPAEIHLRGNFALGFKNWLAERIPEKWRNRVFVHDLVSNSELLSRIAEHDIGFAGEMKYSRSRDLTVTNKILHYLLGGLAVVASDTSGQTEISKQAPLAVHLYQSGSPQDLASVLNRLLGNPTQLAIAKSAALEAARNTYCWEMQAPRLLEAIETALSS